MLTMSSSSLESICRGSAVVVERVEVQRVFHIPEANAAWLNLGPRDRVNLEGALGYPLGSFFKMVKSESPEDVAKKSKKGFKRGHEKLFSWNLLPVDPADPEFVAVVDNAAETRMEEEETRDNRSLVDKNSSQQLSKETLDNFRAEGQSGSEIVQKLVDHSDSFENKTTYSQFKFVKKKRAKYSLVLRIRKPSMRLISKIMYKNDAKKIMNLREDMLSQIVHFGNIRAGTKNLVYETNCQGLVVAAVLERMGSSGKLVHVFQSGVPQSQALNAMNFSEEAMWCLSRLNVMHLQRLEEGDDITQMHKEPSKKDSLGEDSKNDEDSSGQEIKVPERQRLREESLKSFDILKDKDMDSLILACRHHPKSLFLHLLRYLAPSSPFVVFCPYKEPLMETYMAVKQLGQSVVVTLSESWLRYQQVLPDRTHPQVNMSGGGGYLLCGYVIQGLEPKGDKNGAKRAKIDK